jgi:hypothetical protein
MPPRMTPNLREEMLPDNMNERNPAVESNKPVKHRQ